MELLLAMFKRPYNLETFWGRFKAQFDAMTVEHNFTNVIRSNFHRIDEDAFRSSQPTTYQLRRVIKRHKIKTVVNIRGYDDDSPMKLLEERVCRQMGVQIVYVNASSRNIPNDRILEDFKNTYESIEYPILIHCKAGADRAGLASTLYQYYHKKIPIEKTNQLKFWPYGHIKYARTGLIDLFFEMYVKRSKEAPDDLIEFSKTLDRDKIHREFKTTPFFEKLVDKVLRRE
jgi:protein tyrosine phosphatase (PTP) superfamily phosphohydrolase (DUF442 family)